MERLFYSLLGGRLLIVLVVSYLLVAALIAGVSTLVTERVIDNYLITDETEHVDRDMILADASYRQKQETVAGIGSRMAQDAFVAANLRLAAQGNAAALRIVDQQLVQTLTVPALRGSQFLGVLDDRGNLVAGRTTRLNESGVSPALAGINWTTLPIVQTALASGVVQQATEIVPVELLAQVGLDQQARSELIDIPQAAPRLFDPREGSAGLTLAGVYPVSDAGGRVSGAVLAFYLLNNDPELVDQIKNVAGVDTATVFLGDLRVTTNVPLKNGKRAVGTRMAENVYRTTLEQQQEFAGRAYVVTDWFITHYKPLRDHRGQVVGVLYVGARESSFLRLINSFHNQVTRIALLCIALTGIIALPVARIITWPISDLVHAHRRLTEGETTVRVQTHGSGELAVLGQSFNTMAETLHQTAQQLLHKERLAAMGQLAAGVAHEINNPLGTILLFADSLSRDLPADDPRRKDLQTIAQETTRCKDIVANLLNFARQQKVLAQTVEVNALLESVVERLTPQVIFQGIKIVRNLDPRLPQIQADPAQLLQVFTNLINNAAEAMKGQGTLTLATRRVNHTSVEVVIGDTGCGISEEDQRKLFAPFFTTKPPGKGTGLGLSIVYGIIKMHRGQVTVQSRVGEGTRFTITLPLGSPNGNGNSVGNPAENRGAGSEPQTTTAGVTAHG